MFAFNFFNFYLPIFLVAVLAQFFVYMDIYYLVLTQLCIKQVADNLIEYIYPMYETRTRLANLKKKYDDVQWD